MKTTPGDLLTTCPPRAVLERLTLDLNPPIGVHVRQDENPAGGRNLLPFKLWSCHINAHFALKRSRQSMIGSAMKSRCIYPLSNGFVDQVLRLRQDLTLQDYVVYSVGRCRLMMRTYERTTIRRVVDVT
jgi:hypothetical protein